MRPHGSHFPTCLIGRPLAGGDFDRKTPSLVRGAVYKLMNVQHRDILSFSLALPTLHYSASISRFDRAVAKEIHITSSSSVETMTWRIDLLLAFGYRKCPAFLSSREKMLFLVMRTVFYPFCLDLTLQMEFPLYIFWRYKSHLISFTRNLFLKE